MFHKRIELPLILPQMHFRNSRAQLSIYPRPIANHDCADSPGQCRKRRQLKAGSRPMSIFSKEPDHAAENLNSPQHQSPTTDHHQSIGVIMVLDQHLVCQAVVFRSGMQFLLYVLWPVLYLHLLLLPCPLAIRLELSCFY